MKIFDKITAFFKGFNVKEILAKQTVGDILPLVTKLAVAASPDKAIAINLASEFIQKNLETKIKDLPVKDILNEVEKYDSLKPEPVKPAEPIIENKPVDIPVEQPKPLITDLDCVTNWLDKSIKDWKITVELSVNLSGDSINFNFKTPDNWKGFSLTPGGKTLYGNAWVVIKKDNKVYASTFDWFSSNHSKGKFTIDEQGYDHIHRYSQLNNWRPTKGEEIGFIVSSRVRDGGSNGDERSNLIWVKW